MKVLFNMWCAVTEARGKGMMRSDVRNRVTFFKNEKNIFWIVVEKDSFKRKSKEEWER